MITNMLRHPARELVLFGVSQDCGDVVVWWCFCGGGVVVLTSGPRSRISVVSRRVSSCDACVSRLSVAYMCIDSAWPQGQKGYVQTRSSDTDPLTDMSRTRRCVYVEDV